MSDVEAKRPIEIVVQANLQVLPPECDQPPSDNDPLSVKLGRGLKYPNCSRGYAKYLISIGYDPNWAGMLAAQIVAEGYRRAETSRRNSQFARALDRMANPRLPPKAFRDCAAVILQILEDTSLADGLFRDLEPFDGLVFIRALRWCLDGDLSGRSDIIRIAEAIKARVVVLRGPKLSSASAAHEYLIENASLFRPHSYSYSDMRGDFTDALTMATREEFDDPNFDPRPAARRARLKGAAG